MFKWPFSDINSGAFLWAFFEIQSFSLIKKREISWNWNKKERRYDCVVSFNIRENKNKEKLIKVETIIYTPSQKDIEKIIAFGYTETKRTQPYFSKMEDIL